MQSQCNLSAASNFDLTAWVQDNDRPGCVVAVLSGGLVASWAARGFARATAGGHTLTPETVFYVASLSKQFTAACLACLQADGLIDVAASIRNFLPELPPAFDTVTLGHLLHHTSGVPDADPLATIRGLGSDWWNGRGLWDQIDVLTDAKTLLSVPGDRYRYSNEGYWLLAGAIERVGAESLAAFAAKRLFQPLGMYNSHFRDDPDTPQPGLALGHSVGAGSIRPVVTRYHGVGDGGLLTTLEDLARWDLFLSGRSALNSDLPARLRVQGRRNDGALLHYAWGVSVRSHRGAKIISHGGNYIGYVAKLVRFPAYDFSVACLANADDIDVDGLSMATADAVLGDLADLSQPSWTGTIRDDGLAR